MVIRTLSILALCFVTAQVHAADTLADMDIEVSPELRDMGIDPGVKHTAINGRWQAIGAAGVFVTLALLGQRLQTPGGLIVIIGDSIMADLGSSPGVVNLAVPGATTADILKSQVSKIPANATEIVLEGGINNFSLGSHSSGEIVADYQKILAELPPGAKVKLVGILPIDNTRGPMTIDGPVNNAQIASTNAQIGKLCTGRCSMVPSPFGPTLSPAIAPDGVHPRTSTGRAALQQAAR